MPATLACSYCYDCTVDVNPVEERLSVVFHYLLIDHKYSVLFPLPTA